MTKIIVLFTLILGNAYACPQLGGVDLADGDGPWSFIELSINNITLTEAEFNQIPVLAEDFDYEQCRDEMVVTKYQDKATGKVFSAVVTNDDNCDGGNVYGALYNEAMTELLGDIQDSFVSCY